MRRADLLLAAAFTCIAAPLDWCWRQIHCRYSREVRLVGSKFSRSVIGDGPAPTLGFVLYFGLAFQRLHSFRAKTETSRPRPDRPHILTETQGLRRTHSGNFCLAPRHRSSLW